MIRVNINARDHEEAHVASARFTLPQVSLPALEEIVRRELATTVRWAEELGILIGHAKAYLTWGGDEARMLSTTGGAVAASGSSLPQALHDAEVGVTIIVFGRELEDAEARLEGMSAAVAGAFDSWCTYLHECEHHHHDHAHHHDHGHDHGHDHVHGHDHTDEHHHEHDHACTCGHDHAHDHKD